jgi:mycothiol system anti-sigma-R factor
MIKCREAVERLWSYLDRQLEQRQQDELEQHLGLCRHCCGELEFARQVREKLAKTGTDEVPADTRSRLDGMLRSLSS